MTAEPYTDAELDEPSQWDLWRLRATVDALKADRDMLRYELVELEKRRSREIQALAAERDRLREQIRGYLLEEETL